MIKFVKHSLFFLSFLLFLPVTYGQVQVSFNESVTEKFMNYCQAIPWEEIYVHTDREEYIAGEDIWYNIYLIDRQSSKPSSNSKIAYFELLNHDNRPVVQERIRLEGGYGPGQIVLPDTLSSGNYTLRVYTNWMRNFLPSNCYLKNINIYNAITTRASAGRISQGPFESDAVKNSIISSEPGFSQEVNNLNPDTLRILFTADKNFRTVNGSICHLFIQSHGIIDLSATVSLLGTNTRVAIPKNMLKAGISQITTFNAGGKPMAERYIYIPVKEDQNIKLSFVDSCNLRSKVSLRFEFDKKNITSLNGANFSISVAPGLNVNKTPDLTGYMIFGSEFGIIPDEIRNCDLNKVSPEVLDKFLLTLKSNWIDWKAILSEKFPLTKYKAENENHFLYGKLVNKNIQSADSGKFVLMSTPGKVASFQYAITDKNGNFSFNIPINEEVNDIVVQPEEVNKNNSVIIESSFSEEYLSVENSSDSLFTEFPPYISKLSVNYQVSKIYGTSYADFPAKNLIPSIKTKRFYGKPDIELLLSDYIKLPVMSEVFFEILPGVFLKNKKSNFEITIADPYTNVVYKNPPVLFIDGVKIDDAGLIAGLDPEIVERIDVVKEKYIVGDYLFYGLVNVITKAGDFSVVTLPDYAIRLQYKVIDPVNTFKSIEYSTAAIKESRIPDFRNTLYWNPSVKTGVDNKASVDFWSSDFATGYDININGITSDGKLISIKKHIKVK